MIFDWLATAPITLVGVILLLALFAAAWLGWTLRHHGSQPETSEKSASGEGYSVTAILSLLALLTGFTFSLVIDRFEIRRELVLQHANAIGTAYLRVQLLPEPHRARLSGLITGYTENAVALASAAPGKTASLLAKDDDILTRLWAATAAGYDSVQNLPYATSLLDSINSLIDSDGARRAARSAHVPTAVFVVLMIYLVCTAGVLGYVLKLRRGHLVAIFLLVLLTLSQLLILDIDRPTTGSIRESQEPMENLRATLKQQPPAVFDRWRRPVGPQ